jgi:hypothetical protein
VTSSAAGPAGMPVYPHLVEHGIDCRAPPVGGRSRAMVRPLLRATGHLPGVIRFADH